MSSPPPAHALAPAPIRLCGRRGRGRASGFRDPLSRAARIPRGTVPA